MMMLTDDDDDDVIVVRACVCGRANIDMARLMVVIDDVFS